MKILPNLKEISLKENTSMKIGPTVKYLEVTDEVQLLEILKYAKAKKLKIHVLGEGTNSYFANNLKKYFFIKLNFSKDIISIPDPRGSGNALVTAKANVNWHELVMFTVNKNLWGLENLSLIPGSVGAAPVQNIGAYGVELKKTFVSAKVYDTVKNKIITLKNKDCKFSYRHSIFKTFKNRYIILSVTLKLSTKRNPILTYSPLKKLDKKNVTVKEISDLVSKVRMEKLPDYKVFPNSGSFFKNPKISFTKLKKLRKKFSDLVFFKENNKYKIATAWFIEHVLKMKGVQVGNFGTAKTHALVIVNHHGKGEAKELNKFVKLVTKKMETETGLTLEQEVNFVE
jgi:UDP-N-acetylmuramate dehydrogenase